MAKTKNELQTNKRLLLLDDGWSDVVAWNEALQVEQSSYGNSECKWFSVSWLFSECYFYRRMFEAVQTRYKLFLVCILKMLRGFVVCITRYTCPRWLHWLGSPTIQAHTSAYLAWESSIKPQCSCRKHMSKYVVDEKPWYIFFVKWFCFY